MTTINEAALRDLAARAYACYCRTGVVATSDAIDMHDALLALLDERKENTSLRAALAAITAARDEACRIADRVIEATQITPSTDTDFIAKLRVVGDEVES